MSDPSADVPTSPPQPARARPREPMFNLPGIVVVSCVVLIGLHALRAFVSVETDNQIVAYSRLHAGARIDRPASGIRQDHRRPTTPPSITTR